jgi:FkbM family methyltransferase
MMTSEDILRCSVTLENKLYTHKTPFPGKLYLHGWKGRRKVLGMLCRKAFVGLQKAKNNWIARGYIRTTDGDDRPFKFNALNSQYHSLYDPLYSFGYEAETTCLIELIAHDMDYFVNVGSNWGYYPVMLRAGGFRGPITAFEPQYRVYAEMKDILEELGYLANTKIINRAVSDTHKPVRIVIPDGVQSGMAFIEAGNKGEASESVCIDDYNYGKGEYRGVGLFLIDAEGYEAEVLRGAEITIQKTKPCIVFESWKSASSLSHTMEPFRFLEKRGYVFFQPVLLKHTATGDIPLCYGEYWDLERKMVLALMPFSPAYRFLLQKQFNVFACHHETVELLRKLFVEVSYAS